MWRSHPKTLICIVAPLTLAGCPASGVYQGPVVVPAQVGSLEVGECLAFAPEVPDNGRAPARAKNVTAKCDDSTVCTAVADDRGEVVVWAVAAGSTSARVAYDHPTRSVHEEKSLVVNVVAPAQGDALHPRVEPDHTCKVGHRRPTPGP